MILINPFEKELVKKQKDEHFKGLSGKSLIKVLKKEDNTRPAIILSNNAYTQLELNEESNKIVIGLSKITANNLEITTLAIFNNDTITDTEDKALLEKVIKTKKNYHRCQIGFTSKRGVTTTGIEVLRKKFDINDDVDFYIELTTKDDNTTAFALELYTHVPSIAVTPVEPVVPKGILITDEEIEPVVASIDEDLSIQGQVNEIINNDKQDNNIVLVDVMEDIEW